MPLPRHCLRWISVVTQRACCSCLVDIDGKDGETTSLALSTPYLFFMGDRNGHRNEVYRLISRVRPYYVCTSHKYGKEQK